MDNPSKGKLLLPPGAVIIRSKARAIILGGKVKFHQEQDAKVYFKSHQVLEWLLSYIFFCVTRRSRSDESHSLSVSIDFTDVTLVSDDNYRRLQWCDPDDPDDPGESYLVIKNT